ncbi:MAG: AraC family transcriptional regulator [Akkermansiaceae bacterium]|nr:AraC family transcriptional regulator [Akkermansiaceae bacterium]
MSKLPYHHDWKPEFETSLGIQVKWFGSWGEDPEWVVEPSRLGSDLICFFYLKEGAVTAEINGVELPMKPGEMVVWRGGDIFSANNQQPGQPQSHLSACLSLSRDDAANVLLQHGYQRHYKLKHSQAYEQSFETVLEALKGDSRWRNLHVTTAILGWLANLQEDLCPDPGAAAGNPKTIHHVHTAQEWIRQRLGEEVSVADWAGSCGLNVDYFSRLFKSHTGMGPKTWLIEARLQRAARMLAYPDRTVENIAERCGYQCPFHFSRTFKRRFGLPPAAYRRVRQVSGFVDP